MDVTELWAIFGPGVAGAVFGAGWWFWVDAVVCSAVKISFIHYLPGSPFLYQLFSFFFISICLYCYMIVRVFDFVFEFGCRDICVDCRFDVQLCAERGY